jgi:hypothetical protein
MQCLHRPKVFYQGRHPLTEPILKPRNCAAHLSAAQDRVAPWASPLAGPVRYPVTAARNLHPAPCLAGPDTAPREDGMKGYWQGRRPGRTDFHSRQYSSRFAPSYLPDFRQHRLKAPQRAAGTGVIAAQFFDKLFLPAVHRTEATLDVCFGVKALTALRGDLESSGDQRGF